MVMVASSGYYHMMLDKNSYRHLPIWESFAGQPPSPNLNKKTVKSGEGVFCNPLN